jgi:hypothetical protein
LRANRYDGCKAAVEIAMELANGGDKKASKSPAKSPKRAAKSPAKSPSRKRAE